MDTVMDETCSNVTCSLEALYDYDCTFEADPDVAGIGVILAFLIAVVLTLSVVVYGYFFVPDCYSEGRLHRLDGIIIGTTKEVLGRIPGSQSIVRLTQLGEPETLRAILLAFSDQQLVTGVAMLSVGYAGYAQSKGITEYHFSIVSNLSIMAFVVHGSTIKILIDDFRARPGMRVWRGLVTLVFACFVLVTLFPTGNQFWLSNFGMPASCIWANTAGNYVPGDALVFMVLNMGGVVFDIYTILFEFFPGMAWDRLIFCGLLGALRRVAKAFRLRWRHAYRHCRERASDGNNIAWNDVSHLLHAPTVIAHVAVWSSLSTLMWWTTVIAFALKEILTSVAFDLQINWALILGNARRIFSSRVQAPDNGQQGDENSWGFGQAVPVFLLLLPISTCAEAVYKMYQQGRSADHEPFQTQAPVFEVPLTTEPESIDVADGFATSASRAQRLLYPRRRRFDTEQRGSMPTATATATATATIDDTSELSFKTGSSHKVALSLSEGTSTAVPHVLEGDLYKRKWFSWSVVSLMFLTFVGQTLLGVTGYA